MIRLKHLLAEQEKPTVTVSLKPVAWKNKDGQDVWSIHLKVSPEKRDGLWWGQKQTEFGIPSMGKVWTNSTADGLPKSGPGYATAEEAAAAADNFIKTNKYVQSVTKFDPDYLYKFVVEPAA